MKIVEVIFNYGATRTIKCERFDWEYDCLVFRDCYGNVVAKVMPNQLEGYIVESTSQDDGEPCGNEETKMENMTVTEYRGRLIEAFHNTGNDNLIALVCLPDENSFKALENLLRNFWNKKEGEEE